jgi:hypothetical protein
LPYPGPDSADAGIATYLQDLAEAITRSLSSAGTGLVFATFGAALSIASGGGWTDIPMPKLLDVKGAVIISGLDANSLLFMIYPAWDPAVCTHPEDYRGRIWVQVQYSKWSFVGTTNQPSLPGGTGFGCYVMAWGTPSGA